jgi:O-antigen/teichoic acid export membrane protein
LFATGSLIVGVLFDSRYAGAGPMVQILAVALVTYPTLLFGAAFAAVGEPRIAATVSVLQAASLIAFLLLGYAIAGVLGAIWGIALHKIIPTAIISFVARRRQWLNLYKELRIVLLFIIGAALGEGLLVVAHALDIIRPLHRSG